ncbi:Uncharacterised protein [Mycobacterium tuberculosis]|nr:Uncharacterised protein [Mycobacterium tuberculosis]
MATAILCISSKLSSSDSCSGGAGYPACDPACSIEAGSTPSPSIASASLTNVPMTREVKKPRLSLTTIGVLPMAKV